jgi:hypothetical protein
MSFFNTQKLPVLAIAGKTRLPEWHKVIRVASAMRFSTSS